MIPQWLYNNLPSVELIQQRLFAIFTRQQDPNGYVLREIGAKTIFVMLYGFCVDKENWIRPATITCMTTEQAKIDICEERLKWLKRFQSRKAPKDVPDRWYMPNTRESIRDETIRELIRLGAVIEKDGLATTSPAPRYTLQKEFAEIFNPGLTENSLKRNITIWQKSNLSASALARIAMSKKMVTSDSKSVLITLPTGESRKLAPGPSSLLTKAVIEDFAKRFLKNPAVLLISESARKIELKDDELCKAIGLDIDVHAVLPDIILLELGAQEPVIVFVECVATDGPISDRRKKELVDILKKGQYKVDNSAYVTVFADRSSLASRRLISSVAWGTFVWYVTEPESIIYLHEGLQKSVKYLINFMDILAE